MRAEREESRDTAGQRECVSEQCSAEQSRERAVQGDSKAERESLRAVQSRESVTAVQRQSRVEREQCRDRAVQSRAKECVRV